VGKLGKPSIESVSIAQVNMPSKFPPIFTRV
jgi:hypothetical protein